MASVEALTASLERLEPLSRVRLLLAALLLPRAKRQELQEPLRVQAVRSWLLRSEHAKEASSTVQQLPYQDTSSTVFPHLGARRRCSAQQPTTGRSKCTWWRVWPACRTAGWTLSRLPATPVRCVLPQTAAVLSWSMVKDQHASRKASWSSWSATCMQVSTTLKELRQRLAALPGPMPSLVQV